MCKPHWNAYTTALRKAAAAAKAEADTVTDGAPKLEPAQAKPSRAKSKASEPVVESAEAGTE